MADTKFHIGDRVVCVKTPRDIPNDQIPVGSVGTVVHVNVYSETLPYCVDWEHEFKQGYEQWFGEGREMRSHHGWKVKGECIELYDELDESGTVSADDLSKFMSLYGGCQ